VRFCVLILAINVLLLTRIQGSRPVLGYLAFNARVAGAVLGALGEHTRVSDRSIAGDRYALEVSRGCDAVQPTALYLSAILATPAAWKRRLAGIAAGVLVLFALNLVRIVSLYYVGAFAPDWFDVVHVDLWGAVFVLLAVSLWLLWAYRTVTRRAAMESPADAAPALHL